MPYKNSEKKRAYHREYMRRRRAVVKPGNEIILNQAPAQAGPPRRIDRERPYTVESRYPYPAYLVQDGYWYHWETDELVGRAR
jgi:hypothetical protein